jgi:alkaline ceramidase TOD1/glycosyltransferase MUCI70-like protein
MKVAIYTSITASKDSLKEPREHAPADLVLFSDDLRDIPGWDVRPACKLFTDPRRNSRAPKILAHQYLPEHDYSLWIDGSIRLLTPVQKLIDDYLGETDIAIFSHSERRCLYEEAAICSERRLDDPATIAAQTASYARAGYPANNGLHECGVILRRHSARIEALNNAWWSEFCRHSCRDQLSLNYVLYKIGVRPALFPASVWASSLVSYEGHLR